MRRAARRVRSRWRGAVWSAWCRRQTDELSFGASGKVTKISVKVGDTVKAGQVPRRSTRRRACPSSLRPRRRRARRRVCCRRPRRTS
ncbi:biotin/lipoyl-binding protein [Streptomyces sp. NRRL S-337]|uniref:biotin/lipoyl-binding protein n=1 Tax=Streptomyces sp. NRRL S-337 TaxID=1463900 RepID=UPI000D13F366